MTNGLDWPINGIRIGWSLFDGALNDPLLSEQIGSYIPEALAPGAVRAFSFYAPATPGAMPADARVVARTIDVADADGNQYVNDVRVMGGGWTNLTSPMECTSS